MKTILHQLDTLGRIAKWGLELSELDIRFYPRPSIKAQVLVDIILEYTISKEENVHVEGMSSRANLEGQWTLYDAERKL